MRRILLDVKPFRETLDADMCGPASLKILLEYYDIIKSEEELAKMAGHKEGLGTDDKGIERAAKKLGFKVKIKNNSSYKDIEKWLKKDVPVIVDWFTKMNKEATLKDEKEFESDLKVIQLEVLVNNKPAIALYKKMGFKIVAKIPKQIQCKGKLIGEYIMVKHL